MKKLYTRFLTIFFLAVFSSAISLAQTTITIGAGSQTGTSTNAATGDPGPMYRSTDASSFVYSRHHYLYTAAELGAATLPNGNLISKLAWNKDNVAGTNGPCIFQIWIKNSSKTTVGAAGQLWSDLITGSTLVYNNSALNIPAAAGYQEFTFSSPFLYTGGAIEITVNFDISAGTSPWTTAGFSWTRDPINDRTLSYVGSTVPLTTLPNLRTVRPQLRMTYEPSGPCTSPPAPGVASTSVSPVCSGGLVNLSLSGQSTGTGQTYIWQRSATSGGTFTDISTSSAASFLPINPTASFWYRAKVTCNSMDAFSAPVQVLVNPALSGGSYTINSAVATGGTNFISFADAVTAIKCGISGPVVFNVQPGSGPYTEQVTIPQIGGASAINTIKFNGNGATLAFNSTNANERAGITLNGADHIKIDSLIIDGTAGTYGWGILMTNQADSNKISRCTINVSNTNITSVNHAPIVISGSLTSATASGNNGNYDSIMGNTLNGGYYSIVFYGNSTAGAQNLGNVAWNNIVTGTYSYGIYLAYQSGAIISTNDVSRPSRITSTTIAGVFMTTGNIGTLVEKNRIHNMFDAIPTNASTCYGIYTNSAGTVAAPNRFINNLIYSLGGNGLIYGIFNTTSPYMQAYHNTIVLDGQSATTGAAYGIHQAGTALGIDIRNNIVVVSRSGTGIKRVLNYTATGSSITSNQNVLFMSSTSGTSNLLGTWGTATFATLLDWRGANSNAFDQASLSADPLFVSPASGDYKPTEATINDIGANLGVATDIIGVARGTSPDPGAYEFSLSGCSNPPVPGFATASSIFVCPNDVFNLNLTGNSVGNGQTYQWQFSPTGAAPWSNVGTAETSPLFNTSQSVSYFYRAEVKCNAGTPVYSPGIQVVSPALVSGNFTINSALPNGSGNFQTFGDAVNSIKCGINGPVVFNVAPGSGPYVEQVTINQINGASAANTITFNGNGATLAFNSTNTNERAGITLNGADHIKIDSLVIDGTAGTFGWGILMTNRADSNKISRCIINVSNTNITSVAHCPIVISGSTSSATTAGNNGNYDSIMGNTLSGGYYGIVFYGNSAANSQNLGNVAWKNNITGTYAYGVYLAYQSGALISKNDVSRPNRITSTTTGGIFLTTGNIETLIEKNRIHNMFDAMTTNASTFYGIYLNSAATPAQPNRVINNLVYNVGGNGPVYGIYNTTSPNMQAYHNTLSIDGTVATTGTAYGFYQTGTAVGIDFRNNIVNVTRSGTGIKRCVYFVTTGSAIESNRNVLFMNAADGTNNHLGQFGTINYTTLADWQTANSNAYDASSISVDPVFLNPAAGNYTPNTSLVNNIGTALGVQTDIRDSLRSNTDPDPGAYEFSTLTAGLNMGAEGLVTPAASVRGCYTANETVIIRIRNNSTATINFAINPVTVTTNVTGAVTQTLSAIVNTGTLASDSTINVTMPGTLNMSTPGVYTFNANTTLTGDVNPSNDAMLAVNRTKVLLSAGSALASPNSYCSPKPPVFITLNSSAVAGYSDLQWKTSLVSTGNFGNISGANTVPYLVTTPLTQTTYYKLYASCGSVIDSSALLTVTFDNPQVLSTIPGSRCGNGSVTLQATANSGASLNWYTSPSGGTPVFTGPSFTTPVLTANTTYYVSAGAGLSSVNVGLPAANSTATSGAGTTNFGMVFDALTPFTLISVDVYAVAASAATAGTVTIDVVDGAGLILHTATVNVTGNPAASAVKETVTLNFNILAGTNLKLRPGSRSTSISGLLFEPSASAPSGNYGYPFTIPGVVSITTSTLTAPPANTVRNDLYYYFYNWSVSTGCESGRSSVLARTDDCPVPVTLLNFKGERKGTVNSLEWTTATEINNAGFELQRSADGNNFSQLVFIPSKANGGSSTNNLSYNFDDIKPLLGNGYYRLKQIDKDGKFNFSPIVLIKGAKANSITLSSVYPNPTYKDLNLVISSPASEKLNLIITDLTGRVLLNKAVQTISGNNIFNIHVNRLVSGTYFIKAVCANGCETAVQKFVKQ